MNAKLGNGTVKTVATGLILGSLALVGLATPGCDTSSDERVATLHSGSTTEIAGLLDVTAKPEVRGKLAANHNETFLVVAAA